MYTLKNTWVRNWPEKGPLGSNSTPGQRWPGNQSTWRGMWPKAGSIWPHYLSSLQKADQFPGHLWPGMEFGPNGLFSGSRWPGCFFRVYHGLIYWATTLLFHWKRATGHWDYYSSIPSSYFQHNLCQTIRSLRSRHYTHISQKRTLVWLIAGIVIYFLSGWTNFSIEH